MREQLGKRERLARKKRRLKAGVFASSQFPGEWFKIGSNKKRYYRNGSFCRNTQKSEVPVVDAEIRAKSCARVHP